MATNVSHTAAAALAMASISVCPMAAQSILPLSSRKLPNSVEMPCTTRFHTKPMPSLIAMVRSKPRPYQSTSLILSAKLLCRSAKPFRMLAKPSTQAVTTFGQRSVAFVRIAATAMPMRVLTWSKARPARMRSRSSAPDHAV